MTSTVCRPKSILPGQLVCMVLSTLQQKNNKMEIIKIKKINISIAGTIEEKNDGKVIKYPCIYSSAQANSSSIRLNAYAKDPVTL